MLDKSVTREGTMLIKGGIVYLDGWQVSGGGMCREVAALACLYVARELQQRAMALIAMPGGDGRTVSDMPRETPRDWLCPETQAFDAMFDNAGPVHIHQWHTADGERYECACGEVRE